MSTKADGKGDDSNISSLRDAVDELKRAVSYVRDQRGVWQMPPPSVALPAEASGWNFTSFEKFINQRFTDLSLQLRERYESQQQGVTAALQAAEKAVTAALAAAEKAVDKAERAQEHRNEAQNEFRKSLSDLSGLMWTIKEGTAAIEALRRQMDSEDENLNVKIITLERTRIEATEIVRQSMESRISALEAGAANIQGRMWAISALWAVIVAAISIGVSFMKN